MLWGKPFERSSLKPSKMAGDTGHEVDVAASGNATFLPRQTQSLCPVCRTVVDAILEEIDGRVVMSKTCVDHGAFDTVISSNASHYVDAARYERPGKEPLSRLGSVEKGCPHDCGLCPAHRQHTCVGVIEVTSVCDLECPVCFADASGGEHLPLETVRSMVDTLVECEGEVEVLQISGGEPTVHPDILEIVAYAGAAGVRYPMVNTNGIRLADPEFAKALADTVPTGNSAVGLPVVYLQFDGVTDDVFQTLRGSPMLDIKLRALDNCRDAGMSVVLVPTVVRGVNDHQVGAILELALSDPAIKGINYQPAARVGRYDVSGETAMTIPEVLEAVEAQTDHEVGVDSFVTVPCPHPACSVASYVYRDDEVTATLLDLVDTDLFMKHMADQAVPFGQLVSETIESAADVLEMADMVGEEIEGLACCPTGFRVPPVRELIDRVTLVTVHAFMDPSNFDVERASKCCVTEVLPDRRMVPFCVYNNLRRHGGC
jgi:uncharacterized radical SAM superfamily Fe-S cluster-containing enzyme